MWWNSKKKANSSNDDRASSFGSRVTRRLLDAFGGTRSAEEGDDQSPQGSHDAMDTVSLDLGALEASTAPEPKRNASEGDDDAKEPPSRSESPAKEQSSTLPAKAPSAPTSSSMRTDDRDLDNGSNPNAEKKRKIPPPGEATGDSVPTIANDAPDSHTAPNPNAAISSSKEKPQRPKKRRLSEKLKQSEQVESETSLPATEPTESLVPSNIPGAGHAEPPVAKPAEESVVRETISSPSALEPQSRSPTSSPSSTDPDSLHPLSHGDSRREQVRQINHAASLVMQSLQNGPWPSPFRSVSEHDDITDHLNSSVQCHSEHMSIAGASLCEFTRDVIVPAVASHNTSRAIDIGNRAFVGTLILLREVMVQNASSIFGNVVLTSGLEDGTLRSDEDRDYFATAALFSARVLVTSVILAGIGSLSSVETSPDGIGDSFLEAVEAFDEGHDHFVPLPVDETLVATFADGTQLDEDERVAWQISINMQRDRHELLTESCKRKFEDIGCGHPRCTDANAAHVTILERLNQ